MSKKRESILMASMFTFVILSGIGIITLFDRLVRNFGVLVPLGVVVVIFVMSYILTNLALNDDEGLEEYIKTNGFRKEHSNIR